MWCGGLRWCGRAGLGRLANAGEDGTNFYVGVFFDENLEQGASDGGGDLGVDLVGRDLQQRLVGGNGVADRFQPAGDGALSDRLAQRGKSDVSAHGAMSPWTQSCACSGLPARARWASPSASFCVGCA